MFNLGLIREVGVSIAPVAIGFVFGFCLTYLISKKIDHDHY